MSGAIPPLLQYAFMAWCLVKAQGQIYLFLNLILDNKVEIKVPLGLTKYHSVKKRGAPLS
jgi:hypothetical protein